MRGLFPALLALAAFFSVSDASAFEEARRFMGTGFRIEIRDPGLAPERAAQLADGAFRRIGALERKLTSWRDDSLVGRINAAPAGTVFRLDPDTFHVLRTALDVSRRTNGAFDVTVWPLKRLWMEAKRSGELPTEYALENALRRVGWRYILLDEKTRTLTVARPGVQIDLGGIGKGYAVGRAARYLRSHGIRSALVEGGGNTQYVGAPPGGGFWRTGIAHPRKSGEIAAVLEVPADASVSTSGDYEDYFIRSNERFSHIFDPKTGRPVRTGVVSVTVVSHDATLADALSKAPFVMGAAKGLEAAESCGATAVCLSEKGGAIALQSSNAPAPRLSDIQL